MNVKHTLTGIVILNADNVPDCAGDIIDIEGIKLPKHDIPVYMECVHESRKPVGVASLRKEKTQVLAKIELFDNLYQIPYYPCVQGKVLERQGNTIKGALITSISFSISGNADKRIQPIKLEKK